MRKLLSYKLIILLAVFSSLLLMARTVSAASLNDWNPGRIIDNSIFYDAGSMSPDDIQRFLNSKVPNCDTSGSKPSEYGGGTRAQYGASKGYPAPYTCLRDYYENPTTKANNLSGNPVPGGARSAAEIIWDVSHQFGINPKVMLVMLQKESDRLLIDDWPWPSQYKTAMGYGCPDTAPCDSQYYGFYNQMYNAARQFMLYSNNPQVYRYKAGQANTIQYSPNPACGSSSVYIENQATANLYNYTPYQPNQAALNAGYGQASCGAYGNRNFRLYYNDWFGTTYGNDTLSPHPDGTLISQDGVIYINDGAKKRRIMNAEIFASYGYEWGAVKKATSGDRNLGFGIPYDVINPGKLFRADGSGVYTMVWESPTWRKQLVSYTSFTSLGYSWGEVQVIPGNYLSTIPTSTTTYNFTQHPTGTLINQDGYVYMVDQNTRRYISSTVFSSYGWPWSSIKLSTAADRAINEGARYLYREGSLLYDGSNLYVVDIPPTGFEIKSPIGPWECFANKFGYSIQESIRVSTSVLPNETGPLITCT